MLVCCLPIKSRKVLTRDCLKPLPHMSALLMTSVTQIAGRKMAAVAIVFYATLNCRFLTNRTGNRICRWGGGGGGGLPCVYFCIPSLIDGTRDACSLNK